MIGHQRAFDNDLVRGWGSREGRGCKNKDREENDGEEGWKKNKNATLSSMGMRREPC